MLSTFQVQYLVTPAYKSFDRVPGAAPHDFIRGEEVPLFVNALTPIISSTSDDSKLVRLKS